jgi:nitrile hydratase
MIADMNGVHDMGGMHGFGPIEAEADEPVFHAAWEGRAAALLDALGSWIAVNTDAWRHARECLPPAQYLTRSYYAQWFATDLKFILESGLVTREELASGRATPGGPPHEPRVSAEEAVAQVGLENFPRREAEGAPKFRPGDPVVARTVNPAGHTRLPRYARGKRGVVQRDHGAFVFPDTNAHGLGEHPQHVYSVRFAARELWGDAASPNDSVHLDLWDDHLDPA